MDHETRKAITQHIKDARDALGTLEEIAAALREISDSEQEKLDNLPESLQNSERGESFSNWVDALTELSDALGCEDIQSAIDSLEGCES